MYPILINDDGVKSKSDYLAYSPSATIDSSDFANVYKGQWLNDKIINYVFHFIFNKDYPGKSKAVNYFLPTTFFCKLWNGPAVKSYDGYFKHCDLVKVDSLILPCWLQNHWILIVIKPQHKEILALDSIGGYFSQVKQPLNLLSKYLQDYVGSDDADLFDFGNYMWVEQDVVKQNNAIDCGVFICRFAYHIAFEREDQMNDFEVDNGFD